jgi:hypothetical protein
MKERESKGKEQDPKYSIKFYLTFLKINSIFTVNMKLRNKKNHIY